MFTVSPISNARNYRSKYSFNCFLKAGRVFVSRIVAGRLLQIRGPATRKALSPTLVLVPGTKMSDDFDDCSIVCISFKPPEYDHFLEVFRKELLNDKTFSAFDLLLCP